MAQNSESEEEINLDETIKPDDRRSKAVVDDLSKRLAALERTYNETQAQLVESEQKCKNLQRQLESCHDIKELVPQNTSVTQTTSTANVPASNSLSETHQLKYTLPMQSVVSATLPNGSAMETSMLCSSTAHQGVYAKPPVSQITTNLQQVPLMTIASGSQGGYALPSEAPWPMMVNNASHNIYGCMPATSASQATTSGVAPHPHLNNWMTASNVYPNNVSQRKLYDLPEFSGRPEEWPLFMSTFDESTVAYGYTNLENTIRLQKCLKGEARDVVESLLIHSNNVPHVIKQLSFMFGRPECLVRSQILKVKALPIINESEVHQLIPFAIKIQNLVAFLKSAGAQPHLNNPTLLEELVQKLPLSKRLEWARYSSGAGPYPTVELLAQWANENARLIATILPVTTSTDVPGSSTTLKEGKNKPLLHIAPDDNCPKCKMNHRLVECSQFKSMFTQEKWDLAKQNKLCFSCLRLGHTTLQCRNRKKCGINDCQRLHHRMLHDGLKVEAGSVSSSSNEVGPTTIKKPNEEIKEFVSCCKSNESVCLFRIVPIRLHGPKGEVETYALLDEGSSVTLLEEDLAMELGAVGTEDSLTLHWIGNQTTNERSYLVDVKISPWNNKDRKYKLKHARTLKKLSLPTQTLQLKDLQAKYKHLRNLPVYDYVRATPRVLIGINNCYLGVPHRTVSRQRGPVAAKTKMGWVVYGPTEDDIADRKRVFHITHNSLQVLHDLVEDHFKVDEYGTKRPENLVESADIVRAREILESTTRRIDSNSFETGLLWIEDSVVLPSSYSMALRRLEGIERKMKGDTQFAEEYERNLMNYVEKGYARRMQPDEVNRIGAKTWYLPHFGVRNPHKPEKLRIVFDAAATVQGTSLNSVLLKGPDLNQPLPVVLFKFREGAVAVCADIKEMFSQIQIRQEDQDAQRFLWRHGDPSKPIESYVMQSMTFGASCSPCSAQFVKNQNALKFEETHTIAVKYITDQHYVDDFVASFRDEDEAIEVSKAVREIHRGAGFELRGFISHSKFVERELNSDVTNSVNKCLELDKEPSMTADKILGMYWETSCDEFVFRIRRHRIDPDVHSFKRKPTKREVLSIVMSVFDPFGLLANFIIYSKVIIQDLWREGTLWDEDLPDHLFVKWKQWYEQLRNIEHLRIPRNYSPEMFHGSRTLELHVFVDASEVAYAAVAYWRLVSENNIVVSFVAGKAKCAPKKLLSVPRLELTAAVLGTRLKNSILISHSVVPDRCFLWTDSTTVARWIQSEARNYKPFVAHRIAEILDSTKKEDWHWVPTSQNAADEATRTKYPPKYLPDSRWITGPTFLKTTDIFLPISKVDNMNAEDKTELRPCFQVLHIRQIEDIIQVDRFSDYLRLKRTVGWIFRYVSNLKHLVLGEQLSTGELSSRELYKAERMLCRTVQKTTYADEIIALENGEQLSKSSPIFKLTPFLDENFILRLGGRINAAECLPKCTRCPIILPVDHRLTFLIGDRYHQDLHHQNQEVIANEIRRRFWVPNIRSLVKKVKKQCQLCKINRATPKQPLMGQLPIDRLTPFVRPFSYVGLDYFGPMEVTIGRSRVKRWAALFTCLTVRAIHIELAVDLSTDACLICIRNFVNRRGVPVRIRSDNGTNFVGANRELQKNQHQFDSDVIQAEMSSKGIEWLFNCPSNPSAGGCWERLVQSVKKILGQTLKQEAPRPETLQSLLIEAENIINSRPLTHLPVSSEEEEPLTPNHFLLGTTNSTQTPADDQRVGLRKQHQIALQLKNSFWKRWMLEYLPTLTRRTKWFRREAALKLGDLVLICDTDLPRSKWRRGIISATYPGKDGHIRVADVRTNGGILRRPTSKLAVLDVESGETPREFHGGRYVMDKCEDEQSESVPTSNP